MVKKNSAEVLINGKIYTISGYESKEYLQKVASYLNQIEEEITGIEGYRRLSAEEKHLLKNMNLADSYFKACDEREALEQEKEQMDKEIYSLKHDLVDARMEKDKLEARIRELEAQLQEEQKRQNRRDQSSSSRKINKPEQKL
jgi:cell division protein ZapA